MNIEKITILSGNNKFGQKEKFEKLEITKGEVIAIVGPTGAGKSQFLYDLEKLTQGETKSKRKILINDAIPNSKRKYDPQKKLIASLAQTMNFLTDMSVGNFLETHLEARRSNEKDYGSIIEKIIQDANEITGESISIDMNLLSLSGGQSRALMVSDVANVSLSPIVLIDEIENAGINKEKAIEILIKDGKIVFMVTHSPALALNTDKRLVINNGGIVKIIKTSLKEKGIAHYINWIEEYNLKIRDKVRKGKRINNVEIFCIPNKFKN